MSFEPITIVVPGVPIGKGRPRFARTGHAYTPEKTRHYEAMLRDLAAQAMLHREPFTGPIAVMLTAVFPIPESWSNKKKARAEWHTTRPDADNILKLCDGLNQIVWADDNQIAIATVIKKYGRSPSLKIAICEAV